MSFGSSGTHKDTTGHYYYEKKKKRDRVTGSVAVAETAVILQGQYYTTGPFIGETVWICNGETTCSWAQILDGVTPLTCRILLAPGTTCQVTISDTKAPNFLSLSPVWMPFFTSVSFNASSVNVVCTIGGWIP